MMEWLRGKGVAFFSSRQEGIKKLTVSTNGARGLLRERRKEGKKGVLTRIASGAQPDDIGGIEGREGGGGSSLLGEKTRPSRKKRELPARRIVLKRGGLGPVKKGKRRESREGKKDPLGYLYKLRSQKNGGPRAQRERERGVGREKTLVVFEI